MKKRFLGLGAIALGALALASCSNKVVMNNDGEIFHIYVWNEEFKGYFEKYVCDEKDQFMQAAEKKDDSLKPKTYHYDGKEVKWTIVPSEDGQYQKALDLRLKENENASDEERIDMFLAEADYILKYSNSDYTTPIKDLGVSNLTNTYKYTSQVASDSKGVVKGVSFQCCPAGVIYRRSIAKAVLGTDDPAQVQKKISSWSKFDEVAAQMKAKGYYMTSSYAETYRAFSNNVTKPWVNDDEKLQFDSQIEAWMDQAERYIKNGYTMTHGIWEEGCTNEMFATFLGASRFFGGDPFTCGMTVSRNLFCFDFRPADSTNLMFASFLGAGRLFGNDPIAYGVTGRGYLFISREVAT